MKELNHREQILVGLGAALASNCVPCIEFHIPEAKKTGLSSDQIEAAIAIADKVRRVPARLVLQTARARVEESPAIPKETSEGGCGCAAGGESGRVS